MTAQPALVGENVATQTIKVMQAEHVSPNDARMMTLTQESQATQQPSMASVGIVVLTSSQTAFLTKDL